MKTCKKCGQTKPLDDFHRESKAHDGRTFYCKECNKKKARDWYANNVDHAKERMRTHNRTRAGEFRDYNLRRKYGITAAEYDALLEEQGGVCAICGGTERIEDGRAMAVDHCHRTNKVRGILCSHCNRAIGMLGDDPEVIARAVTYLNG